MTSVAVMDVGSLRRNDLDRLEAQLVHKFSPPLRHEDVERCLVSCIAMFESAPVRMYLPLLIERAATDRLRAEVEIVEHTNSS